MDRVAVAADGADLHVILFDKVLEFPQLGFAVQQDLRVRVLFAGVSASADLDHFEPQRGEVFQRFFQRPVAEHVC